MAEKIYIIVYRVQTLDVYNELDSCTLNSKAFADEGKAKLEATHDIGKLLGHIPPITWYLDDEGRPFVKSDIFEGETHTGEPCKRIARWEIHALTVQQFDH